MGNFLKPAQIKFAYLQHKRRSEVTEPVITPREELSLQVEIVLAHRYLYYVMEQPIISGEEYDMLERKAIADKAKGYDRLLAPESQFKEDYPFTTPYTVRMLLKAHEDKTNAPLIPS